MVKIKTVDYSTLSKQAVGRPKIYDRNLDHKLSIQLKTCFSNGFTKVKFKIRHGVPSIYFTNRETNIIKEDEYLNDIHLDSFNLEYDNLKEGIYNIKPIGYHWFELSLVESESENCCIIKRIKE